MWPVQPHVSDDPPVDRWEAELADRLVLETLEALAKLERAGASHDELEDALELQRRRLTDGQVRRQQQVAAQELTRRWRERDGTAS